MQKHIEELLERAKQQVIKNTRNSRNHEKNFYINEAIWHISLAQAMLRKGWDSENNETRSDTKSPAAHQT